MRDLEATVKELTKKLKPQIETYFKELMRDGYTVDKIMARQRLLRELRSNRESVGSVEFKNRLTTLLCTARYKEVKAVLAEEQKLKDQLEKLRGEKLELQRKGKHCFKL